MTKKIVEDFVTILKLVSSCIRLSHPVILDIRYFFHLKVGGLYNSNTWGREEWEEYIVEHCEYDLSMFVRALCRDKWFRENIITVLKDEISKLEEKKLERID